MSEILIDYMIHCLDERGTAIDFRSYGAYEDE